MEERSTPPGSRDSGRIDSESDRSTSTGSARWEQRAGFSLFFDVSHDDEGREHWQTRLYHEEAGDEATLPGARATLWTSWLLDRLGPAGNEPARPAGASTLAGQRVHDLTVEIVGARLAGGDSVPEGSRSDAVRVEVELRISGLPDLQRALGAAVIDAVLGQGDE